MKIEERIAVLYRQAVGEETDKIMKLPESGSSRLYFRVFGSDRTLIGVFNADLKENSAFLSFTRSLGSLGLPVPEVIAEEGSGEIYLLSDLGDETLFATLINFRDKESEFPSSIIDLYKKVLKLLPQIQVRGGAVIDYSLCYPRHAFDRQSMRWDLNYFKYYFLKLAHIPFDEQALEDDFETFAGFLLQADSRYFMYRDFQSRNIMILGNEPYFIDYQGGRRGGLQYDLASLLYDAKADLPQPVRDHLLEFYLDELEIVIPEVRSEFLRFFPGFVLIRILQALGAYGYRGYYEKKSHFLQSIPYAINNLRILRGLWQSGSFGVDLPVLFSLLDHLIQNPLPNPVSGIRHPASGIRHPASGIRHPAFSPLTVTIISFSYKKGIPEDPTGNGGGFVFDCRALPNPGRYEAYKQLTGRDQPVIEFLTQERDVDNFLQPVFSLVGQSVSTYLERGFSHLLVSFGCTGGQHRSVYCAERLNEYLSDRFEIEVEVTVKLNHTNLPVN